MEEKNDKIASEMCQSIWENLQPATSLEDATHRWTTTEIALAIQQHTGLSITNDQLYEHLKESGYKYMIDTTAINVKYVWLLKVRTV